MVRRPHRHRCGALLFLLAITLWQGALSSAVVAEGPAELDALLATGLADLMQIQVVTLAHQRDRFLNEGFDSFIDKPFRRERIYGCLHEMLGAEFEYAESEAAPAVDGASALASLTGVASVLPDVLFGGLQAAVQVGDINSIRQNLDEIAAMGGDAAILAEHLSRMAQDYDIRGIADWLDTVQR